MEKIKIFLSDPQILFREGIHYVLSGEDDFEVIGETTNNEEAFARIEDNPPRVAILNMSDDKLGGTEITQRIKRNLPMVSVILVIDNGDEDMLFSAMKSGASAYLTKYADPEYLVSVIRAVARGNQPIVEALLMPGVALRVMIEFEDLAIFGEQLNNVLARLLPREIEVLDYIGSGNGIEQMAVKLSIDEETIRSNLMLILAKLVANEQAKVIVESVQRSLLAIGANVVKMTETQAEYISEKKLPEFQIRRLERFKSFVSGLSVHNWLLWRRK